MTESAQVRLSTPLIGPLLNDEETARAFATLILTRLHGKPELVKQQPLRVKDEGSDWVVMGSHEEAGKLPGTGAWLIRVRKSDCRVETFGHYEPLELPDDLKPFFPPGKG